MQPFLMLCVLKAQKAADENNLPVVENVLRQYEHAGRHPEVSSLNAVITMYARMRQLDKALATFSKLTSTPKLSPNAKSYRAVLLAYARVRCSIANAFVQFSALWSHKAFLTLIAAKSRGVQSGAICCSRS